MRRLVWIIAFLLGVMLPATAHAWDIHRFSSVVEVLLDGRLEITETVDVDFGQEARHGIYRDIPVEYTDRLGQPSRLDWTLLGVTNAHGVAQPYTLSREGWSQRVRIGSPQATVRGRQAYLIRYRIEGALNRFPEHDELYWNVTGNEWAIPIQEARVLVRLPASVDPALIRATAFTGVSGSRAQDAAVVIGEDRTITCTTTRSLSAYEGLTIIVGWPVGIVSVPPRRQPIAESSWRQPLAPQPSWSEPYGGWFALNGAGLVGLPLLAFLGMYGWWRRRGKEFPGRESLVVEYEPPDGLRPAEVGALIDDRIHPRDITASVIDLAVRGYVAIEPVGTTLWGSSAKDYRFIRRKTFQGDATLLPHEQRILKELFGTTRDSRLLSDLEMEFYKELPAIQTAVYEQLIRQGYLDSQPAHVRRRYWIAAVVLGFVGWGLTITLFVAGWGIGLIVSAIILGVFGYFMPRKTIKGRQAVDRIRGLEEFLSRTDRDRIGRMNPKELFERLLPYAMALGVANRWAAAFEGLYTTPPSWYLGESPTTFSSGEFVGRLNQATHSMASTFASAPRTAASSGSSGFGGGGSSGGGFGGGGGGAW